MGTTARSALRQAMAQEQSLYESGTCTATGTTTSFIDTTRRKERDKYWNGSDFLFTGGTGSGDKGRTTDFVQSTSTVTVAQTVTASDSTTTYELYRPPFAIDHYNFALTAALDEAYAEGFARRGFDETLYTQRQSDFALPTTVEEVSEVYVSAQNLIIDPDWWGSGAGWTLHSNASFGNNGDNQERTLNHVSTGANNYSTVPISVTPGVRYSFRVRAISDGTAVAVARYQFLNASGALIGSATNFGTTSSATSSVLSGTFICPVGAYMVRLSLGSSSASGTVRFWEHSLRVERHYEKVPREYWDLQWNGNTATLVFDRFVLPPSRVLLLKGRRTLETLSADTDTVSFDTPESRAFINLALAVMWEQTIGQIPNVDRAQAMENAAMRRHKFHELGKAFFDNFQMHRTVSVPSC